MILQEVHILYIGAEVVWKELVTLTSKCSHGLKFMVTLTWHHVRLLTSNNEAQNAIVYYADH